MFRTLIRTILRPTTLAAALACTTVIAAPQGARADYVGGGYLTDAIGCEEAGWPNYIEMFRARYIPAEVQGRYSDIVLDMAVGGTFVYRTWGELDESTRWRSTRGYSVWGSLYSQTPRPRVQVLERASATTGGATVPEHHEIRLSLRIRHFNGVRDCLVTAHMMLRDEHSDRPTY